MQKNKPQTYIHIAALLITAALAGSCKKLIDIPASPPNQISFADQYADSSAAMSAVAWVYSYDANTTAGFGFSDAMLTEAGALSSDELKSTSTYNPDMASFYNYNLTPINGSATSLWSGPYTALYSVNAVIEGVTSSTGLKPTFKKQITAEMKVLRALYYFNLVNCFGNVPIVTGIDYKVNTLLPRASVDSVYGQIVSDLTAAQQALPVAYPSDGHARPNLYTADALLAKVHLYRKQWQDAYNEANTVIGSGTYSLATDPNEVFLEGSPEAIWQLPATGPWNVTEEASNFIPQSSGTIPNYIATSWLIDAFEPGDVRMQDWLQQTVVNGETLYYPYKYRNVLTTDQPTEDYMILRLAEQYLIRAEASAQLGNGAAALADVNTIRARAGLSPSTADPSDKNEVMNAIMHERQVELFTEWANRWFDLKRTGTAAAVLTSEKTGFTNTALLYPIPRTELQNNVNLKQNPGY